VRPDSRAVHAGRELRARDPLAPPLTQTSVYVFEDLDDYDQVASGRRSGHVYGRNSNENTALLESAVSELEGAEAGVAAASGMAAIFATVLAAAPRPAPLVVERDAYGVTLAVLRLDLAPLGYQVREVDMSDLGAVRRAVDGAALLICETITNPLSKVVDLPEICRIAGEAGCVVLVDNTYASPLLCRPLEHGATAVAHSATKYLGGHSDLVAGVVAGERSLMAEVRARVVRTGGSLGPFEAWLALRGMRTLGLRMRRHSDNAMLLAKTLRDVPGVAQVHHPGLDGSPYEELAEMLLPDGTGGMLAFDLDGGRQAVQDMLSRFRMVRFAASFAGVETTISYPDITSHRALSPEERLQRGITPGTVRVSAGIEDPEDVLADFRQAILPVR
jgi:cystathionine beta-lyase/cystathionine gamma-synthase